MKWLIYFLILAGSYIMPNPYLKLPIHSICFDHAGTELQHDGWYILEWLRRLYIPNGSFEEYDAGDFAHWTKTINGNGTLSQDADSYFGDHAAKFDLWGWPAEIFLRTTDLMVINRNLQYTLSMYYKTTVSALAYIRQYDSSDVYISGADILLELNTAGSYTQANLVINPSDFHIDCVKVMVSLETVAPTTVMYIDGVILTTYNPNDIVDWDEFNQLYNDDIETFTFDEEAPLLGSKFQGGDDPSLIERSEDGELVSELKRYPLQDMTIKTRLYSKAAIRQLRRFHAKVRHLPFIYVDEDSIETDVIWRGSCPNPPTSKDTGVYVVIIPLEYRYITEGA